MHHITEVLHQPGGEVTGRLYPGMGHIVNENELEFMREMMAGLVNHKP